MPRWAVWLLILCLCSGWAKGLVLPFEGPGGNATAQAFARSLGVAPPSLAALLLPDLPWEGSYERVTGSLYTPGGARLALESTRAEWVLVGQTGEKGELALFLATPKETATARFTQPRLALRWLGSRLGLKPGPFEPDPRQEQDLARLAQGELEGVSRFPVPRALYEAALVLAKSGELKASLEPLPRPLVEFWTGLAAGKLLPAYEAMFDLQENRTALAQSQARKLAQGNALERIAAVMVLQAGKDPSWRAVARGLSEYAPEIAYGWEQRGFAALDEDRPDEAAQAFSRVLELLPKNRSAWTNLGWAQYLRGDKARSLRASLQSLRLGTDPTAMYNLGLVRALYGDFVGARAAYTRALESDEEGIYRLAIEDLQNSGDAHMSYWMGFLAERVGLLEQAKGYYRAFLEANPKHPLAGSARRALAQEGKLEVRLVALLLRPDGPDARPFRAGEVLFPQVRLVGSPYLSQQPLSVRLLDAQGGALAQASKKIAFRAFTTELEELAPGVKLPAEGRYVLEVRYGEAVVRQPLEALPASLARQLYVLGLEPRGSNGMPLLEVAELLGLEGDRLLLQKLEAEFKAAAPTAALNPRLSQPLKAGPYAGQSVAELLRKAERRVLEAFLRAAVQKPQLLGENDVVNAFVNWVQK
ncbi:tetratricopeptide repeat protein [Calidithermus roseus]|uniref:tetratricopeptide repeat protein n=1 Tax=Calidithermus roseus TaxID=1644118 RepID=UPI000E65A8D6|nr:tetratricopeptide repeat protein [Calidithermus roseus]